MSAMSSRPRSRAPRAARTCKCKEGFARSERAERILLARKRERDRGSRGGKVERAKR